jgi:hypothetical protein
MDSINPDMAEYNLNQFHEAIRAMGTNAIPVLVEMMFVRDSAFKTKLIALIKRQHFIKISIFSADLKNQWATVALTRRLRYSPQVDYAPHEVPWLAVTSVTLSLRDPNADADTRVFALAALTALKNDPNVKYAIPDVVKLLEDKDLSVRMSATNALQQIAPYRKETRTGVKP